MGDPWGTAHGSNSNWPVLILRVAYFGQYPATAWPLVARAQPERIRVVAVVSAAVQTDPEYVDRVNAFRDRLKQLGWVDGRNIRLVLRFTGNEPDRMADIIAEVIKLAPDVVHTIGTPGTLAMKRVTNAIPIVFAQVTDPVGTGVVSNLSRPGANITGFTNYEYAIGGKWLELLKEVNPMLKRVLVLYNPANANWKGFLQAVEEAGRSFQVTVVAGEVHTQVLDKFADGPNDGGLIAQPDGSLLTYRDRIIDIANRGRVATIFPARTFVDSGGLLFYGTKPTDLNYRAASYVDRILRGAAPGELPVQAPTKFELVINLKTARMLGLSLPPTLLGRADEVIE